MQNQTQPETGKTQPKSTEKRIDVWYRQGDAYTDQYDCEVIYGNADVNVEYDRQICELNYPYQCPGVFVVRPKEVPVIVLCRGVDNTGDVEARVIDMYVFTQKGWKFIKVYEKRVPL